MNSPLDQQRARGERSDAILARAATLRQYGHWGLAEVLEDEAALQAMLEQKTREATASPKDITLQIPKGFARLIAAEARETSRLRPQFTALATLSEVLYDAF